MRLNSGRRVLINLLRVSSLVRQVLVDTIFDLMNQRLTVDSIFDADVALNLSASLSLSLPLSHFQLEWQRQPRRSQHFALEQQR